MKIGFLGPHGSYSELAAVQTNPNAELIPFPTIAKIFESVASSSIDVGVVPYENIIEGVVTETLDLLYTYADKIKIVDTTILQIKHALGAKDSKVPLSAVYSKDQALRQCANYLQESFPEAKLVPTPSTSYAIEHIITNNIHNAGAIGNIQTLTKYGMQIICNDISNNKQNKTKFLVIRHAKSNNIKTSSPNTTFIIIYPRHDKISLLYEILSIVSNQYKINIISFHSRPDTSGAYRFYFELEGSAESSNISACLEALSKQLYRSETSINMLGSCPVSTFSERKIFRIGIVGGKGVMGTWFRSFFINAGYKVIIHDLDTEISLKECVMQSDAIIINVPIKETINVIKNTCSYLSQEKLIVDNTSIKTEPVKAMLEYSPENIEVLGMHTIFGPNTPSLQGQNIAFTKTSRSKKMANEFINIFIKYGANVSYCTPAYHDKQMAFHQNLVHFIIFVLGEVLISNFKDVNDIKSFTSPNSLTCLAVLGRLLNGDPDLYSEIQQYNSQGVGMIKEFAMAVSRFLKLIETGNFTEFTHTLVNEHQHLGSGFIQDLDNLATSLQNVLYAIKDK